MAIPPYLASEEIKVDNKERFFSVELKSKINLKNITLTNGGHENVLIEGNIGKLQYAAFSDNVVLEVVGNKGTLRINITPEEIKAKSKEEAKKNE